MFLPMENQNKERARSALWIRLTTLFLPPYIMDEKSSLHQFVGRGGGPLVRQKQDSHVSRTTGILPSICRENQGRRYINDEVSEKL